MMILLVIILAYLIGSIPSGLWVGKIFYGKDIRQHGSGNLGGTNTFRTLGKKAGLVVTIMDVLKGTLATFLPIMLGVDVHPLIPGAIAVVGHIYPIFAGFRGGKAVATSAGLILGFAPLMFVALFFTFFLCLYITKYVSLSSMITAVIAFIIALFTKEVPLIFAIGLLVIFIVYRHRSNIKRIKNGTEPKIKWL